MAKIRNEFGEDRIVPWLGGRLVVDGAVVEVPDEELYAYTQQEGWSPADDASQELHDAAVAAIDAADAEAEAEAEGDPYEGRIPNEHWLLDDIKGWVEYHGVDVGDATKKADILAAIAAADTDGSN